MLDKYNPEKLLEFYKKHLFEELLPFWLERAIDKEDGGYFTCFTNDGARLVSHDKYIWSQGRMVWLFSRLSGMNIKEISKEDRELFIELGKNGADFILDNCFLENGNCAFLLDKKGKPKEAISGKGYDISTFADCFVVLGLGYYAGITGQKEILNKVVGLYESILNRIEKGIFRITPDIVPESYKCHSIPMIMLNVSYELSETLKKLGDGRYIQVEEKCRMFSDEILCNFVQEDSTLVEVIGIDNKPVDSFLGRHVNPGHSMESMWFVIKEAERRNFNEGISSACKVVKRIFEVGWDNEYGGLLYYVDRDGGMPKGTGKGDEEIKAAERILRDWDNKLWWPHSEALYTSLLSYFMTDDTDFLEIYKKLHEYTFNTFPNPDKTTGEWIQLRKRSGIPQDKVVGGRLPVKDPYHIIRNVILIIELLEDVRAKKARAEMYTQYIGQYKTVDGGDTDGLGQYPSSREISRDNPQETRTICP